MHADLWTIEPHRRATLLGDTLESAYHDRKRQRDAKARTADAEKGVTDDEAAAAPGRDNSITLALALYSCCKVAFWSTGVLKLAGDVLTVTSPLVSQELLAYLTRAYLHSRAPDAVPSPRSVGYGFALAIILFLMQGTSTNPNAPRVGL